MSIKLLERNISIILLIIPWTLSSQNIDTLFSKASVLLTQKKYQKAVEIYSKIISLESANSKAWKNKIYCYYNLHDFQKTINNCNKLLELNLPIKETFYPKYYRGIAYYGLENWGKALEDLETTSAFFNIKGNTDLLVANAKFELGRYSEAIKDFNYCLKNKENTDSIKVTINQLLGYCYLYSDSLIKAKEFCKKVFYLDSSSKEGFFLKASIYKKEELNSEAIECYSKILSKDSSETRALYGRGRCYSNIKKYYLAKVDLLKYAKRVNYTTNSLMALAALESNQKNYNAALTYLKIGLKKKSNSCDLNNQIAWTILLCKRYSEALGFANNALKVDSTNIAAIDTRGTIYYKMAKYSEAIKDFNYTLHVDSLYPNSLYYRALCYFKTNNTNSGCIDLKKVKNYELMEGEKPVNELLDVNCKK